MNVVPNIMQTVPFFMVTSMELSLTFYIEGLGFQVIKKWEPAGKIEWCRLQRDAGVLMLQENRRLNPTKEKPGIGVSVCFQCADAIALYREFSSKNLSVTEPFVGNNMWVIFVKDPDGFALSFESITDIPEETKYAEYMKKR